MRFTGWTLTCFIYNEWFNSTIAIDFKGNKCEQLAFERLSYKEVEVHYKCNKFKCEMFASKNAYVLISGAIEQLVLITK